MRGDLVANRKYLMTACLLVSITSAPLLAQNVRVPAGFHAKSGTRCESYTNTGWAQEVIHDKTGIVMAFVPAGEFLMGSSTKQSQSESDEGPRHKVRITKAFYIGKFEVTQKEWNSLMKHNPSYYTGNNRLPVERVSWEDCQHFLKRGGDGLRSPTEAEWECSCRAGTTTRCYSGDDGNLDAVAWYGINNKRTTHPVGLKKANAWGLHDMHGNVWEWCQDWYREKYAHEQTVSDPTGPGTGVHRVSRGGSRNSSAAECRSAYRFGRSPARRTYIVGFRVAKSIP